MAELAWLLPDGREQSMLFDATVRDSHESTATITEHPVEEGANISDHIRPGLDRVTLQIVVSNKPVVPPTDHNDGITGSIRSSDLIGADGQVLGQAQVLLFDEPLARVRSVYEELLNLKNTGTAVRVLTSLREYEDMGMLRVSPVREAASGDSLVATVEFQQVRVVSSEVVAAPEPRETRGNLNQERGRENTEDEGDAGQSVLASFADFVGGFGS
jgi:hypothetical protein